ncbi:MAG: chorismate synthase [Alphaproteobacteria bacterium]|jgi:chorismate synthase
MYNSFGNLFKVTTWGESHGIALGCVIDGCPSGITLDAYTDIQPFMDRRKPGTGKYVTQRQEGDQVQILSGVFEGKTTGTPISLLIQNQDQRSKDYSEISNKYRPGHADYTYDKKYGIRDYRGGGRSSARETAARVAAGAVAQKVLEKLHPNLSVIAYMDSLGDNRIENFDQNIINDNPFFSPDAEKIAVWSHIMDNIRKKGSSIGGIIGCIVQNMPVGIGEPIYKKIDSELAAAMMTINAVKGFEIGDGFASAALTGEENADEIFADADGNVTFSSNHAGGVLGGISTGQDLTMRVAIKPTSSILVTRHTITTNHENTNIITKGRHDPCVAIRGVPVVQAMAACVILDGILMHRSRSNC